MKKRIVPALLAAALLGLLPVSAAFADTAGLPQEADIAYLQESGLVQGMDGENFAPEALLTRAQAVTLLGRQARTSGRAGGSYADVPEDAYYRDYLSWACEKGLLDVEEGGAFRPDAAITHEELSALLDRYLAYLGRTDVQIAPMGSGALNRAEGAAYFAALERSLSARETSLLTLTASDGVELTGKLDLPAGEEAVEKIVFYINGSGPNTYDNHRQSGSLVFDYYDLFAQQFAARGVGFFRWSTRGVTPGETPPYFADVDEETYRTYLPATSVSDIGEWIGKLRKNERLQDAEIYLLGWSEGTIIAPLAAKAFPGEIDGLLLCGYCNDRMDEIFDWQQTGHSSMIFYQTYFDTDGDGRISPEEFAADPYGLAASVLGNTPFDQIDLNGDGVLTAEDFAIMLAPTRQAFYDAVERGDDAWLAENYSVRLTSGWFKAHQALAPNRETMLTLELPITIFHGTMDANCDVAGVYAIEESFAQHGKDNLTVHVYPGYDHDLLYSVYAATGAMPEAFEDLFQAVVD